MSIEKTVVTQDSSCVGCKFLYVLEEGYSNYTVTDVEVRCALNGNSNLPAPLPCDWIREHDNWPYTQRSRCERYGPGPEVRIDVEHSEGPGDFSTDEEQIAAICAHAEVGRYGRTDGT